MSATDSSPIEPTFDAQVGQYYLEYDQSNAASIGTTISLAVSSLTGLDPTDLRPLYPAIDCDVLTGLLSGRNPDAQVSFEYHGYRIQVSGDGLIRFTPTNLTSR